MTELTDLATSIANSKEQIRQAIEDRGMECGVEVPLADYADKIRNMTVSNEVDSLYAINYTGAAISEGDKVFLNKKGLDNTRDFDASISTSRYHVSICLTDTSGNNGWDSNNGTIYDTNTGLMIANSISYFWDNSTSSSYPYSSVFDYIFPRYDSYGRLYYRNFIFQNGIMSQRQVYFLNDDYDYFIPGTTNNKKIYLYKMNRANNTILKTLTINTTISVGLMSSASLILINNALYLKYKGNNNIYKVLLNDIDTEYTFNTIDISPSPVYKINGFNEITLDNKYCFVATENDSASQNVLGFYYTVYEIKNDEFYQIKVFNNSKLMDILNDRACVTFNNKTGILCAYKTGNDRHWGVFKYENGDFTTIAINIPKEKNPGEVQCCGMSISDDLSTLNIRNRFFKLEQAPDGSYKAISYSNGLTEDILTGIAQADAENGERFEVITLLPPEITTTLRVVNEGNEPADVTETIVE